MKIERINDTDYKIYYYKNEIDENAIYDEVKCIVKSIQKRLKLHGFYRIIVVYKKIGLFLILKMLEDTFYKDTLDIKIEIKDLDVYYKTTDYFIIKGYSNIRYKDGMYYCKVDSSFDKILEKVEFGDFIFDFDTIK